MTRKIITAETLRGGNRQDGITVRTILDFSVSECLDDFLRFGRLLGPEGLGGSVGLNRNVGRCRSHFPSCCLRRFPGLSRFGGLGVTLVTQDKRLLHDFKQVIGLAKVGGIGHEFRADGFNLCHGLAHA